MRFAIDLPAFAELADVPNLVRVAQDAEAAGWDALLLWDHVNWAIGPPTPTADAWLALAAIAAATERIRIGTAVTPLPRRLPQEVARQATTLHGLSRGRFTLGVGSGGGGPFDQAEFGSFGLATDPGVRGAQLDEALGVITALWSGEPVTHHGEYYAADGVTFLPASPYRPGSATIPIWVGGVWGRPRPLRRAARYDGYFPVREDGRDWTPEDVGSARAQLAEARPPDADHEVALILGGSSAPDDAARLSELAAAGLAWWSEGLPPWRQSTDQLFARIARGPVR